MRITSEDMNDLYVNRVDTFHITDCIGMKFVDDPKFAKSIGLMVHVKHQESGLQYKQLFFIKDRTAHQMLHAIDSHLNHAPGPDSNL